jgi:hypothetical protein
VPWLWVRFLESGGIKYGLTCSKAYSLLIHAKPTQAIEAIRLVFYCIGSRFFQNNFFSGFKSTANV